MNFATNNGYELAPQTEKVRFTMDGVKYCCLKKAAEGKTPCLWIFCSDEERLDCAIWDAKTCELRDTIFFSDVELYKMIPFLLNKHPELFEKK